MDVSRWEVESYEPGGQDPVAWLIDPDGTRWLFKPAIVRSDRRQGEDWAEKIAAELAHWSNFEPPGLSCDPDEANPVHLPGPPSRVTLGDAEWRGPDQ